MCLSSYLFNTESEVKMSKATNKVIDLTEQEQCELYEAWINKHPLAAEEVSEMSTRKIDGDQWILTVMYKRKMAGVDVDMGFGKGGTKLAALKDLLNDMNEDLKTTQRVKK